jgi:transposase InsO family protein
VGNRSYRNGAWLIGGELVHRQTFPTRAAARRAIFEFIEVFYNRGRLHSTLNYRTPAEYEEERRKPSKAQAA